MKFMNQLPSLKGKRVLMRIDVNIAVLNNRVVEDGTIRLDAVIPSIAYCLKRGARVVLVAHRGRPKGKDESLSLSAIAKYIQKKLKHKVIMCDGFDDVTAQKIASLPDHAIAMLENIRFHEGEDKNDKNFSKWLASLCDIYVNDAFAVDHRKTASTVGITKYVPAYAGLLLQKELQALSKVIKKPLRKSVVVMGGVKAETKIPAIVNMLRTVDYALMGGYLSGQLRMIQEGKKIDGISALHHKQLKKLMKDGRIILPIDVVVWDKNADAIRVVACDEGCFLNEGEGIFDIGPRTAQHYAELIQSAKTVIWNGPLGMFEDARFAKGTNATARAIGKTKAYTIVGGGEILMVIKKARMLKKIDFVSTGGGAMLTFLAGEKMPGIDALR